MLLQFLIQLIRTSQESRLAVLLTTNMATTAGSKQAFWFVHFCSAITEKGSNSCRGAESTGCGAVKEEFFHQRECF